MDGQQSNNRDLIDIEKSSSDLSDDNNITEEDPQMKNKALNNNGKSFNNIYAK